MRERVDEARRRTAAWAAMLITLALMVLFGAGSLVGWLLLAVGLVLLACAAAPADWWEDED